MKLNKTIEELKAEGFLVKEDLIAGEICYLVQPGHIGQTWTADNLIYRSSIWNSNGELISAGFKKFFNYSENYQLVPDPTDEDLKNGSMVAKIDGSLLIVSKYKGELIHRTRGTFNAENLANGKDIEYFKMKYPRVFNNFWLMHEDCTMLYEWTSPDNVIVLNYGKEPELRFIGMINHKDYSLVPQSNLDVIGDIINVDRPHRFSFASINEMVATVKDLKGEEGLIVYYNNEQTQKKFKAEEYLNLHRFKSNASLTTVLDMYIDMNFKTVEEYRGYIKKNFDWECFTMVEPYINKVVNAHIDVNCDIRDVGDFIKSLNINCLSRKEQALSIIKNMMVHF